MRQSNVVVVQEVESASGPKVSIVHRAYARRAADVLVPETEYARGMRLINQLIDGSHPGFRLDVRSVGL